MSALVKGQAAGKMKMGEMLACKQGGGRIRFGREVHRFLRILLASKYMWFVHGTDYNDYIAYIIVKITINCLWKT